MIHKKKNLVNFVKNQVLPILWMSNNVLKTWILSQHLIKENVNIDPFNKPDQRMYIFVVAESPTNGLNHSP